MTNNDGIIEVRVADLRQLFNAIDPSPFRDKDLDPNAEEFIVGWAQELPRDATLALVVHLDSAAGASTDATHLDDAVHEFFKNRAVNTRRRLRKLLSVGRVSLLIGIAVLVAFIGLGDAVARMIGENGLASIVSESLIIGGWVAMWRPLEIFLYDWWPIRAEARLYDRLATMPVRVNHRAPA